MDEVKLKNIKPFDELTITDDFMFGAVMSEPKHLKPLLEYILGIKIAEITYPEKQKTIDVNYGYKGVRLDVYCEDDEKTVYSVEIQTTDQRNLPKRIRYYRDMIDINILDKGGDYRNLKKSFVIFICTFDYFEKGRYMYTFKNQCQEDSSLYLKDETTAIVLNSTGTIGEINEELKSTLRYMSGQTPTGGYAEVLDKAVKEVKVNEKWRRDYMTMAMKLQEREEIGGLEKSVSAIRKGRGKGSDDFLIDVLGLNKTLFIEISNMLDKNPDKSDWDIANTILYG
ncbi:MAG: Rpn family recombination-promoting nuclease/putative transposase [Ruminiclostridium sp.]|nr:Rpn family recombination-promoting nuclease/putative transposase [Ruminiclostridium sp.]